MPEAKPVVDANEITKWDYEYHAVHPVSGKTLASDSLSNLKAEIKARGWTMAWISCTSGSMSCGQNVVDEAPYEPRY